MKETVFTSLESQRVRLRCLLEADLSPFLAYLNDPLVARYQTWESYTEQQARDVIQKQQNLFRVCRGSWFTFAVELKAAGVLIGHVAFKMDDHQQAGDVLSRTFGLRASGR